MLDSSAQRALLTGMPRFAQTRWTGGERGMIGETKQAMRPAF